MDFLEIIADRRDGRVHSAEALEQLAKGAATGSVPDYQLSAWLMAAYLKPLSEQETADLTIAMANSGSRIDLTGLPKPWLDKHSTGGVGDKTSLVLLPTLAACGLTVVKMSGRGLGITGGTVDKLSSIPGFRLDLSPEEMKAQAARIGLALTGQSPSLAPADKALYSLRDVTGTVASVPLIVSSILSKKIAGGAETIVLDVKCGRGAFMENLESAKNLAEALVKIGQRCGLKVTASISDMNQPLGSAVGNALEVVEAARILRGIALSEPSERFRELCLHYAGEALMACGKAASIEDGRRMATEVLESGKALAKAREWISAQGGDAKVLDAPELLPKAAVRKETLYGLGEAYVKSVDAHRIGQAVVDLGGGRREKDDKVDLGVGIVLGVCVGSKVMDRTTLYTIHAKSEEDAARIQKDLEGCIEFSDGPVERPPLILASYGL